MFIRMLITEETRETKVREENGSCFVRVLFLSFFYFLSFLQFYLLLIFFCSFHSFLLLLVARWIRGMSRRYNCQRATLRMEKISRNRNFSWLGAHARRRISKDAAVSYFGRPATLWGGCLGLMSRPLSASKLRNGISNEQHRIAIIYIFARKFT